MVKLNLWEWLSKEEKWSDWQDTTTFEPVRLNRSVEQIPEGAIRMSSDQVITIQEKRLKNWQPQSDIWAFKHGGPIVGVAAIINGVLINKYFRTKFALKNISRLASYTPVVAMPMLMAMFAQTNIARRVMLMPDCPSCLETRAGAMQVISSVVYSTVMSPILTIAMSRRHHTYLIENNFQPTAIHAVKTTPLVRNCFVLMIAVNFGIGFLIAYFQGQAMETIVLKEARMIAQKALDE